ncbi:TPA: hypothetical protein R7O75_001017 [Acinetobacter baumannii]|nr:hypothetical protein [Acinetobacter baumannii]
MIFELINPSDKCTFEAPNLKIAALVTCVLGQKTLNQSFAKYKQLGGSASSVATVTPLNNPCKGL